MEEHQHLPNANRLSILTATILLAYALTPFIKFPETQLVLSLPGVVFPFRFTFSTVVAVLVALLAAFGTDWLLRGHPHLGDQKTSLHSMLPAMTAWVIGVPISSIAMGFEWWVVFALGGILLVLVLLAEYIVVDFSDVRHSLAAIGLTAVSYALYLILAIAIRQPDFRLYLLLPALFFPMALVAYRNLFLRLNGRRCLTWSLGIALIIGQIGMGLHYWPVSPLGYGLILLGPAYALTSLAGSIEENRSWRTLWIEPAVMLAVLWGLALIFDKR
jgi:hypothetical protein